jgi:uncharacterized DUF497 family protein
VAVIRFEWDEAKNLSNQRKHGVSFEEASQVFLDPLHVLVQERVEAGEQRWQAFGLVRYALFLMVAYTVLEKHEDGRWVDVIRIISARRADKGERQRYEEENR